MSANLAECSCHDKIIPSQGSKNRDYLRRIVGILDGNNGSDDPAAQTRPVDDLSLFSLGRYSASLSQFGIQEEIFDGRGAIRWLHRNSDAYRVIRRMSRRTFYEMRDFFF
jgi:hypothetical protein